MSCWTMSSKKPGLWPGQPGRGIAVPSGGPQGAKVIFGWSVRCVGSKGVATAGLRWAWEGAWATTLRTCTARAQAPAASLVALITARQLALCYMYLCDRLCNIVARCRVHEYHLPIIVFSHAFCEPYLCYVPCNVVEGCPTCQFDVLHDPNCVIVCAMLLMDARFTRWMS